MTKETTQYFEDLFDCKELNELLNDLDQQVQIKVDDHGDYPELNELLTAKLKEVIRAVSNCNPEEEDEDHYESHLFTEAEITRRQMMLPW